MLIVDHLLWSSDTESDPLQSPATVLDLELLVMAFYLYQDFEEVDVLLLNDVIRYPSSCEQQPVSTWTLMTSHHLCSLIGSSCERAQLLLEFLSVLLRPVQSLQSLRRVQGLRRVQVYRELMKMMKMMKMMVVLVLSGVLWVSADVLHQDIALLGCSDSDGEDMYALDGEELWYADFKHNKGVDSQPPFVDHVTFPGTYEQAVANQEICKQNLKTAREALKDPSPEKDPPSSHMIYTRDKVEPGQKNSLICHVAGFYPAPVEFSWTKNEENVTEGSSSNVPFVNKDGTFNQFSTLEFTPQLGDIYGCTVKHLALDQPQTKFYDVQQTQPSIGPAVFCGVGLTVGLLGVAAGTFFLIKGNECS